MPMDHRVALYDGTRRRGMVRFRTLLVTGPRDYTCLPDGTLTLAEAVEVSDRLRDLPAVSMGTVGKYQWEVEEE